MFKVLGTARPPFLVLGPASVMLAAAVVAQTGKVQVLSLLGVTVAAVAAHVSVNALNEYSDFRSGLDSRTRRTPFSGGSGTLVQHPELVRQAFWLGILALVPVLLIGGYFVFSAGWALLPLGLLGVLAVVLYTDSITRRPWLCLGIAGFGFGPVMVWGSAIALAGESSIAGFWASLPVFFAVNNLLLLNQLPDIEADQTAGRQTFPMVYGKPAAARVYTVFALCSGAVLVLAVVVGGLPAGALMGLAAVALSMGVALILPSRLDSIEQLLPLLGFNVAATVALPVLMAAGLLLF